MVKSIKTKKAIDIVDVHITSKSGTVDTFSEYPLLDGSKQYTIELTEFVSPLAGQDPLPPISWFQDELNISHNLTQLLEIRKRVPGTAINNVINTRLPNTIPDTKIIFTRDERRQMCSVGELVYQLQRYFDEIRDSFVFQKTGDRDELVYNIDIINTKTTTKNDKQEEIDAFTATRVIVIANIASTQSEIVQLQANIQLIDDLAAKDAEIQAYSNTNQVAIDAAETALEQKDLLITHHQEIVNEGEGGANNYTAQNILDSQALLNQHLTERIPLQAAFAALYDPLQALVDERAELQEDVDKLENTKTGYENALATAQATLQTLNTQKTALETDITELETDIFHLQEAIDNAEHEIDGFNYFDGRQYGKTPLEIIDTGRFFVRVSCLPDGTLRLFLSKWFTNNFFILVNKYGETLLGIGDDGYIAFRSDGSEKGRSGLSADGINIIKAQVTETIELIGRYTLERHYDHRCRIEVSTQMPIPLSTQWTTAGKQQISNAIGTFPIITKTEAAIRMNNEGVTDGTLRYTNEVLSGDIAFRKAEDKISERYLLQDSRFFHNIRLDVSIVRKVWMRDNQFHYKRETIEYGDGEAWSAKLRFRSLN